MKAITIQTKFPELIYTGVKTLETRRWKTKHRGDLLVASGKSSNYCPGEGICVVNVTDVRPMELTDEAAAMVAYDPSLYVWELTDLRHFEVNPVVRGYPGMFNFDVTDYKLIEPQKPPFSGDINSLPYTANVPHLEVISSIHWLAMRGAASSWYRTFYEENKVLILATLGRPAKSSKVIFSVTKNYTPSLAMTYLAYRLGVDYLGDLFVLANTKGVSYLSLNYRLDDQPITVAVKGDWVQYWSRMLNVCPATTHYLLSTQTDGDWSKQPNINTPFQQSLKNV